MEEHNERISSALRRTCSPTSEFVPAPLSVPFRFAFPSEIRWSWVNHSTSRTSIDAKMVYDRGRSNVQWWYCYRPTYCFFGPPCLMCELWRFGGGPEVECLRHCPSCVRSCEALVRRQCREMKAFIVVSYWVFRHCYWECVDEFQIRYCISSSTPDYACRLLCV